MTRPRAQLLGAVGIGATLLVAAWLRLAYRPWVFVEGEVLPLGLDAYYHLRRMQQAAAGPLPLADPFLRWPQAAVVPWAPGFDHLGGLCLRLGGRPLAMALPVLLGLATVALVIHLARRLAVRTAPLAAGLGAGLVAALLPQAAAVAAVGRVDHHVAEVLTVAAFMAWALGSLEDRPRPLRQELLAAGVTFLGLWLFHGSVLYLGLAATVVGVGRAWRPRARLWGSGALGLLLASLALALAFRPATLAHGHALSFLYASYLQPLLVAVAALGVALGVAATRIGDEGGPWVSRGLAARRLALLAIGGLGLAALVVAIAGPELRAALSGWLARDERWMATIGETMPLLDDGGRRVHRYFGAFGLLAPLTLPVGLAVAYRARRATGLGLAAFSLALVGLSLLQARFGRAATLALALTTGLALAGAVV
ncbi:MAG: hypothetical protein KC731_42450, partial [Myxococcales bacterium]|nr:hypothetical protein [Myxococcales bacterium]